MSEQARKHNDAVIRREEARERSLPETARHDCPVCKLRVSETAGVVCVSCAVGALGRFGWGPLGG